MNDQDYIQLFMENGAYRTDLWRQHTILDASEDTVIAFAKEVEVRVLEELWRIKGSENVYLSIADMIAQRRDE